MRTTLNIDDLILTQASHLTGISQKTELIRLGLKSLISERSRSRLANLGGKDPKARVATRRRLKSK